MFHANFDMIPSFILFPSWSLTRKTFGPWSSPPTKRRACTTDTQGIPDGEVGGMNLFINISQLLYERRSDLLTLQHALLECEARTLHSVAMSLWSPC